MTVEEAQKAAGRTFTYFGQNKNGSITYYHDPGSTYTGPDNRIITPACPLEIYGFNNNRFFFALTFPKEDPDQRNYKRTFAELTFLFGNPVFWPFPSFVPGVSELWLAKETAATLLHSDKDNITALYFIRRQYHLDYIKDQSIKRPASHQTPVRP